MKSRFWIYILIFITVILAIALWRRPVQPAAVSTVAMKMKLQSNNVLAPILAANNTNTIVQKNPISQISQPQTTNSRVEKLIRELESKNVSVSFYGRVIDQDSNGVPEVRIVMHVRQWHLDATADPWGNKFPKFERSTDSNGNFSLEGTTGDSLSIESVSKEGYRLSPKAPNMFGYGYGNVPVPFHPDPQNPAIIKMWKESGTKAPLITGSHVFGIDSGKAYTLDLIQGKKFVGETAGDLRVAITRPSEVNSKDRYPWSYSIEIVNGGLIETQDDFMYLAPESGYQPEFTRQYNPTDSDWNLDVQKQFFIQTRNGQVYGRLQVVIHSVYNVHSAIEINYAINPNGSRNLQP